MNLIEGSLKYKHVTISVLLLLFAIGANSLLHMPRREDPKITIRQGLVVAYYPGANSAQVEEQLTFKLEQYLFRFEEVDKAKTYSTSKDGMVIVNLALNQNVKQPDVFWSKLRHELLIASKIDFPSGVIGPFINSDFGDTEAMVISIESNEADYSQLKSYAKKLEDKIRTIEAVSKIKRIGEQDEQIVITSNSEKLAQYDVSLQNVVQVIQAQNAINPTGDIDIDNIKAPLYTSGYYNTVAEVENQIIGATQTGALIRVKDVAEVKREFAEPKSLISVNGNKAMMLSVQMQEGNNIVDFGHDVEAIINATQADLPTGVEINTIVNQPHLVDHNVSHFIREFFLAIIAVVIVVILLLPFRVSIVAALAIPMTVAMTFAMMHIFGIELHQVSLAALILVLGMVVDDAIVIADNYVELLDKGLDNWTAAWRSASDLVVPVLAATVTIIASFIPMVLLDGSIGEFIFALPITVAIALGSSFFVAMFFTPMLCYFFIKEGIHSKVEDKKSRFSMLDSMQNIYNRTLEWCVKFPTLTVIGSLIPIIFAFFIYKFGLKQRFFPTAERNQFVVELWMPTGTKLEATKESIYKVEELIKTDERVNSYATFVGQSAPRFYYNFSPEVPTSNYAQILINTTDDLTAEELAADLSRELPNLIPEGRPQVKLMEQGQPMNAPVEVRISGEDITELKRIAAQMEDILKNAPGSSLVRNDFAEDYYGVSIQLKPEANRLGFTTTNVSKYIYTGFKGADISTIYEGENPIHLLLKLDDDNRQSPEDLENTYIESPVTHSKVPLRQIATLKPEWHTGRIMHRNGVRTITVQSQTKPGVLPAELLSQVKKQIDQVQLPTSYRLEYGGEHENKTSTFKKMIRVLVISLVLIFFILLFQFKNIKETTIVMLTIPMSLFGALLGLYVTGNNFSFTAFIGLISLSGIVVRNAIILIDHTNELIHEGMDIKQASVESAKRRLRPIFLTAMAAAIGVLPMIISNSPMWAPLASVIAVGVIWSMLMALLAVPVLYMNWVKPKDKKEMLLKNE